MGRITRIQITAVSSNIKEHGRIASVPNTIPISIPLVSIRNKRTIINRIRNPVTIRIRIRARRRTRRRRHRRRRTHRRRSRRRRARRGRRRCAGRSRGRRRTRREVNPTTLLPTPQLVQRQISLTAARPLHRSTKNIRSSLILRPIHQPTRIPLTTNITIRISSQTQPAIRSLHTLNRRLKNRPKRKRANNHNKHDARNKHHILKSSLAFLRQSYPNTKSV